MLNVKKTLTKILTNLKSPIIVKTFNTPELTIAASTTVWVYGENWTPTAVTGYTPVACCPASATNSGGVLPHITLIPDIYGTRFVGNIRNIYTTSVSDTYAVPVIYMRNDLV